MRNGVNALDFISSPPVSPATLTQSRLMIQANFGTAYDEAKWNLWVDMLREEQWSEERFKRTLKWFLKNKHFSNWTIADWFQYGVKVYPYSWLLKKQTTEGWSRNDYEIYKLADGTIVYKPKDGETLPFEKIEVSNERAKALYTCYLCHKPVHEDEWNAHISICGKV